MYLFVRMHVLRPLDKRQSETVSLEFVVIKNHEWLQICIREKSRDISANVLRCGRDERVFLSRLLSCASIYTFIFRNDVRVKRTDRAHRHEIAYPQPRNRRERAKHGTELLYINTWNNYISSNFLANVPTKLYNKFANNYNSDIQNTSNYSDISNI